MDMKKLSDQQYSKYAEALRLAPGYFKQDLSDKELVDQHILNLVRNDYKLKRDLFVKQTQEGDDLDDV